MSYINNLNAVRRSFFFWMFIIALSFNLIAQNKSESKVNKIKFRITVNDNNDKALSGVQIIVGEGNNYFESDESGEVSFEASTSDLLKFSFPNYNDSILSAASLIGVKTFILNKSKLFASSNDIIPLPFNNLKKRNITGSSIILTGEQLEKYQGTDIRNAFTGLATGLEVRELNGSPGLNIMERYTTGAEKIDMQIRGRSPMFVIDGVPTEMTEMPLDPVEIETVTIIKDIIGKAMFGPTGADGIIYIKTKHGKLNERTINVNFEKGVSIVDRMPIWANGTDYAQLNNLARANSGILPLYSDEVIAKYAANDGYDMYYPSNDFRSMMFKNTMEYNRANISFSGGNDIIKYFSYLGYSGESDLFKIGSVSNYNRIISRSNLDIKINDYLKVKLGIYGAIGIRNSPNYGAGTEFLAFDYAIDDANTIPPIAFPIYANNSPTLDKPWYGVTSNYGYNPVGGLVGKGFFNETARSGASNIAFDYDMSHIIKGLSSETFVGFNVFNQVRLGKVEDYTAYIANPSVTAQNVDTILLTKVHDGVDQADLSKLADYYYQRFAVYETLKHEMNFGKANLQNTLTYYATRVTRDGYEDSQRQQNYIWSGILNYDDKYSVQAVLNYAGTYSFAKDKRYELFPSIGASWVISEENFMKPVRFINYLKLRAEAGVLGYDNYQAPFYFRDDYDTSTTGSSFGPYTTNTWFGNSSENSVPRTVQSRYGNPDLGWEIRKELNLGFDALMLKGKLNLELNYYNNLREGVISQVSNLVPAVVGLSAFPRLNYNNIRYFGVETGLNYSDNIGDFKFTIGGNATVQDSKYEKIDEPKYRFDYQSRLDEPVDGIVGLDYIGKFATDEETLLVPQLFDDVLHAGDLKYKDLNNDGVIDDNDKSLIGHSAPRLFYALNVILKYKSFELTLIGTGRAFYDVLLSNSYFWNGWGDGNYSSFVRNNLGGDYPRLSYNKVNNNFITSNFWLESGDFLKIQNIELAYNFPEKFLKKAGIRGVRIFVKGANLYTFSKIKDVDPESINSGVTTYPLMKNITSGIKLMF